MIGFNLTIEEIILDNRTRLTLNQTNSVSIGSFISTGKVEIYLGTTQFQKILINDSIFIAQCKKNSVVSVNDTLSIKLNSNADFSNCIFIYPTNITELVDSSTLLTANYVPTIIPNLISLGENNMSKNQFFHCLFYIFFKFLMEFILKYILLKLLEISL